MDDESRAEVLARVLTGLGEYTVIDAIETPDGLVVEVIATRAEAPCRACGLHRSGEVVSDLSCDRRRGAREAVPVARAATGVQMSDAWL